ncbi:MAG: alpha/beta hydrolase-fold protein [Lachnospiraceae bacterium]|nr:alpha/beta hydrolase-fold protein [Lachnospiraceae bacterium]
MNVNRLPEEIIEIPDEYYSSMDGGGTLENLNYTTYESFTYEEKSQVLEKRAVVYLPAGYDENKKYNVLYLMHGGWSNETTYMGSPENGARDFKNVLDHAIANGEVDPLIVVLPTYNNTSGEDSGDYSLAIQLTDQYHNELMNDLIPAVIDTYSTYAEDSSYDSIVASRDHRAFAGFSMGSVQTWRTFQYNLNAFRYFMPSSGNAGSSGEVYAQLVRDQGYTADAFFIFAASGTADFAYSSFKSQIQAMAANEMFTVADNEQEGNLYFLEKEGYSHDGYAAMTYFYNGLTWLFKDRNAAETRETAESAETDQTADAALSEAAMFTLSSTVSEVINDMAFGDYGRLLFLVDRTVDSESTLEQISSSSTYVWYNYIQPEKTVEIVNYLKEQSIGGNQIFYPIYSSEEIAVDPSKADTGLFFFRGNPGEKFAVMNAGGGFMYVGAMHDSFPHTLEASRNGYNAFALIYRPEDPYTDLAQAIAYIHDHADELQVDPENYSLWGGSAGARMAATLGNGDYLYQLTGREDIPQAAAVIMQYTGYSTVSSADAPTYVNVGTSDGIANWRTMQKRLENLDRLGIPTEFHSYQGLPHGYGLGTGTVAEGWIRDAFAFWEENSTF